MKRNLSSLILGCVLSTSFCQAEVLVHNGQMKSLLAGGRSESRRTFRAIVVTDPQAGRIVKISYFPSARGLKLYTTEEFDGLFLLKSHVARGVTNTVLAKGESSISQSNGVTVLSLFAQGHDARLTVNRGVTMTFPRTLSWSYAGLAPSSIEGTCETWQETGVLRFDTSRTSSFNGGGQTLEGAVARVKADLEYHGYREFDLK